MEKSELTFLESIIKLFAHLEKYMFIIFQISNLYPPLRLLRQLRHYLLKLYKLYYIYR